MLNSIDYATLLQYSPRGKTDISKQSRVVKDRIKAGRIDGNFATRISDIIEDNKAILESFLNENVTLVAAPRSSLIRATDLWPAHEICKLLSSLNLGTISTCLIRTKAIRKSSLYFKADERPTIAEQFESMGVENYAPTENITLVDDVLTLGRTAIAGASRLIEKFPNATIRSFSLIRTMGFIPEIDGILNVVAGTITYNNVNGKSNRVP
jgi:pyrimidine operon attenuation protein/uracil phosphoribosyltransferase